MSRQPGKDRQIAQLRAQLEEEQESSAILRQTIKVQQSNIDSTLEQLKAAEQNLIQASSTSPFLRRLPIEIRIHIYQLLLVNPKLSETQSIGKTVNWGKDIKFDLAPTILRTCKAIYNEAEPILYGSNTFVIECIGGYGSIDSLHVPQSPLTRYDESDYDDLNDSDTEDEIGHRSSLHFGVETQFSFKTFKPLEKIRSWRILTSAYRPMPANPIPAKSFVHFCQALCQQAPTQPQRSLEIILVLAKVPATPGIPSSEEAQYKFSEKQLGLLLQPLRLLRDIKLVLNIAQFDNDLPISEKVCATGSGYYFPYSEAQTLEVNLERFMNLAPPIVQKYHALAEDLSPIEKVFKMHERLEQYVHAFERSGKFNKDLITLQRGYEGSLGECRHFGWQLPHPSLGNPFKVGRYHPVEAAFSSKCLISISGDAISKLPIYQTTLHQFSRSLTIVIFKCSQAWITYKSCQLYLAIKWSLKLMFYTPGAIVAKDKEDIAEFKAARASVLKELEPQYKRMIVASRKLRDFVQKEARSGVFNECPGCGTIHRYEEDPYENGLRADLDRYIFELDKMPVLLDRMMPDHIQIQVMKGNIIYDSEYSNLERERLFKKLRWMQKQELHLMDSSRTAAQIARWLKLLVDNMWIECGFASRRRENLFVDDTTDIGCKINKKLGVGLMDEHLEWHHESWDSEDEYMHTYDE